MLRQWPNATAPRARSKRDPGRAQRRRARPGRLPSPHGGEHPQTFLRGVERAGVPFQDIMSVYNHACHPENRHFYPDGTSLPQCQGTQSPADGCYAPTLRCGDNPGYQYQNGNPVRPRPIYWLDRAASFPGPIPPQYDRGGFLDGARRKWGEGDLRTTAVEALGFDHGVDENVAP